MSDKDKIKEAKRLIVNYGRFDGAHHKDWVLDQIFRVLCGDEYNGEVVKSMDGGDGPATYSWEIGIPP